MYQELKTLLWNCFRVESLCKTMKICVWQKKYYFRWAFFNDCIENAILKYSFSWGGKKCQTNKNSSIIPLNISFRNCSLFKTLKFLYLLESNKKVFLNFPCCFYLAVWNPFFVHMIDLVRVFSIISILGRCFYKPGNLILSKISGFRRGCMPPQ